MQGCGASAPAAASAGEVSIARCASHRVRWCHFFGVYGLGFLVEEGGLFHDGNTGGGGVGSGCQQNEVFQSRRRSR
jgi:hypothetical protein